MKAHTSTADVQPRTERSVISKTASFLAAVAVLSVLWWLTSDGDRSPRGEALLRAHFHVPADVEFTKALYPRRGSSNQIEGVVTFDEERYADYVSTLDDPAIWRAQPVEILRDVTEPPFAPRALAWEKLPAVHFAGTRNVTFGQLSRDLATNARAGRAFCLALRLPEGQRRNSWTRPVRKGHEHLWPLETPAALDGYNGIACNEMGRSERPKFTIYGVLLDETRTLHMIIR